MEPQPRMESQTELWRQYNLRCHPGVGTNFLASHPSTLRSLRFAQIIQFQPSLSEVGRDCDIGSQGVNHARQSHQVRPNNINPYPWVPPEFPLSYISSGLGGKACYEIQGKSGYRSPLLVSLRETRIWVDVSL